METVYFYCAVIGGALLLIQVAMLLFGGADADFDTDVSPEADLAGAEASSILFQLSLKTVIAFVTFFGLAGMACLDAAVSDANTLLTAVAAGAGAFCLVGYLMRFLYSLQTSGNLDLGKAVGQTAKVYLRVPAGREGFGKITLAVAGRTVVRKAVTGGDMIPTGAEVVIQKLVAPDTFEVKTPQ